MTTPRFIATTTIALALAATACSSTSDAGTAGDTGVGDTPTAACATDPRAQAFTLNTKQASLKGSFAIAIESATPAPPQTNDNTWTILLTDAAGTPVDGATFAFDTYMPDHRHHGSIVPAIQPSGKAPGEYVVSRLNLFMPGLWQITFTVTSSDGATTDSVQWIFCVPQ